MDREKLAAPSPYVRRVEKTPQAIAALLDPDAQDAFRAEFTAALERAGEVFDLEPVNEMLQRWWVRAVMADNPELAEGIAQDRERLAAGDESIVAETWTYTEDGSHQVRTS